MVVAAVVIESKHKETGSQSSAVSASTSLPACPECPAMISIPAGDFVMGSPGTEPSRYANEGPQHTVHVRAFEVAKYPVTRGEWRRYVNETGHKSFVGCNWLNPGFPQDDRHPVVCVGWREVQDYIGWLSHQSGRHFRLLTEAEYEYVNRAGTQTAYFWGNSDRDLPAYANLIGHGTTPVGGLKANRWGLFDTTGNVWEWTQDCFNDYANTPTDGSASEWGGCQDRVARGGSWVKLNDPRPGGFAAGQVSRYLRSACRNDLYNFAVENDIGFRLARTP